MGRLVIFLIMGLALLVAWKATNVIDIAIFMLGLSSAELTANWAQWWWWRFNGPARIAASFGGPLIFVMVKFKLFLGISAYWHVLLGIGLTTLLCVTVALLTAPEPESALRHFYRKARPLGFWRPVANKSGSVPEDRRSIVRGFGIAAAGTIAVAAGIIGLYHLYVGQWLILLVGLLISVFFSAIFRIHYSRFLGRLQDRLKPG